jgi:hypothetical protein
MTVKYHGTVTAWHGGNLNICPCHEFFSHTRSALTVEMDDDDSINDVMMTISNFIYCIMVNVMVIMMTINNNDADPVI